MRLTKHLPDRPLTPDELHEHAEREEFEIVEHAGPGDEVTLFVVECGGRHHILQHSDERGWRFMQ